MDKAMNENPEAIEMYSTNETICYDGRKIRWTGKLVSSGCIGGIGICVHQTKGGKWVAWICTHRYDDETLDDVVKADSKRKLIATLHRHIWSREENFLGVFQICFPEDDIWVDVIE
jgi:hypothetical protein